jgi:RNase P subunit RPR2
MIVRKGIINNKELQAVVGNWGKPRKEEHSPRRVAEQPEIAKHRSRKAKSRIKIDREARRYGCPFCGNILLIVVKSKYSFLDKRAKKCHFCFARNRISGCPACKGDIWYSRGVYKHGPSGPDCGFAGKKLVRSRP